MINQFLPCSVMSLKIGDVIYMGDRAVKIVKLWHEESEERGDIVCINTDYPSGSDDRYEGCNSTLTSEVAIIGGFAHITNQFTSNSKVYRLLQLSKEQLEKLQDCPLLPI